jgi:ABC-2 type transport system ATP-binding protein
VESFCEELIVLEKGKVIIEGRIDQVKKDYKKQNIKIIADVDVELLKSIPGVYQVIKNSNEIIVKIENESVAESVFDYVKTCKNIIKYDVEQASLSEIFIDKVGKANEKV